MRVGKQDNAVTAISTSDLHTINVRGKELSSQIIGKMDFTSYFFFLVTGIEPDEKQKLMLDATLVAIAEHGLVPSNQAARMTLAAAPDALQGAVAAGILGCGSVVLGSTESCGRFLAEVLAVADRDGIDVEKAAEQALVNLRAERKPVPGFGHPQHRDGDPRANRLMALAEEHGMAGRHVQLIEAMAPIVEKVWGRKLPLNVSGAIPSVMLDAGFPLTALKGIPILARTASLIAHVNEEMSRSIGFILAGKAAEGIDYDGPALSDNWTD